MKYSLEEYTNKDILNPNIFEGSKMSPEARIMFLKIAEKFYHELGIDFPIVDIILTGSSANYNWTDYSDIDIHLMIDFSKLKETESWRSFFNYKKKKFSEDFKVEFAGKPIELYVQDVNEPHVSTGVYSLLRNEWVLEPVYNKVDIDDQEIMMKAQPLMDEIDSLIKKGNGNTEELKDKIKRFRQAGLETGGEYSIENLAFKELRNNGYLQKLYDFSKEDHDEQSIDIEDQQLDIIKDFIKFATSALSLERLPEKITLSYDTNLAKERHSFGVFAPQENTIWLYVKDRNVADILRTLAHELIHRKQDEQGRIEINSGDTGSEIENEANALAGVLLRNYGKSHTEIYEIMKNKNLINKLITEAIQEKVVKSGGYNVKEVIKKIEEDAHNASKAQQIEALQLEIDSINEKLAQEVLNETDEAEMNIKKMRISRKRLQDQIHKLRGYVPGDDDKVTDTVTPEEEAEAGELAEVSTVKVPDPNAGKYVMVAMGKKNPIIGNKYFDSIADAEKYKREKNIKYSVEIKKLPAEKSVYKSDKISERKLSKAETKKKEKVFKAIDKEANLNKKGEFKSKSGKTYNAYAISTAQAKK